MPSREVLHKYMYIIRASINTVHILCSYLPLLVVLIVQLSILSHLELQCLPPYDSLHISRAISWVTLPCKVSIHIFDENFFLSVLRVVHGCDFNSVHCLLATEAFINSKRITKTGPPRSLCRRVVATPSCSRARGCGYARLAFSSQG